MSDNNAPRYYKFRDWELFNKEIKRYKTIETMALALGLHKGSISRYLNNPDVIIEAVTAKQISQALRIDFDKLFQSVKVSKNRSDPNNINKKDEEELEISEKILVGLKENIKKRLMITHDITYTNQILRIIDDIIIEASFLGVVSEREKNSDYIINAIGKRRNTR